MCNRATLHQKILAVALSGTFLFALSVDSANAAVVPGVGSVSAQSTANCGNPVQKALDGPSRLCPRPLATTIIRAPKHLQHV